MNLETPPFPTPDKTLLVFYPDPINRLRNLIQKFILSQKLVSKMGLEQKVKVLNRKEKSDIC